MKLLKASESLGFFLAEDGQNYTPIVDIRKEDLLRLANLTLHENLVEFDDCDDEEIKHHAHLIVYRSVLGQLKSLRSRREAFVDESARLYLEDYERYGSPVGGSEGSYPTKPFEQGRQPASS
jgi:hypothetical protein